MSALLATLGCFVLMGAFFWVDRKRSADVSAAVWIPFFWMFFAGSRFASQWLSLGAPESVGAEVYSDGSPIDRNVFLTLVVLALWVLVRRNIDWKAFLSKNAWVVIFFLFCALSAAWSDDPFVSLKRFVKGVGNLAIALVLLTERHPQQALGVVLRRLAFVLVPLSILFIKYFPDLGRAYHMGVPMFTGVAFQKNSLGQLCMVLAVYFSWALLLRRSSLRTGSQAPPSDRIVAPIMLTMLAWLLHMAQSATALALTVGAVGFFIVARMPRLEQHPRRLVTLGLTLIVAIPTLEYFFNVKDRAIRMLGREPDLTDRAPVWRMVLDMVPNTWVGAGYETFWSGQRMYHIWEKVGGILQAHNGYIDMYANLGLVGVGMLLIAVLVGLVYAVRELRTNYANAVLRIAFILVALIYNYTEAAFKPLNNVFILLLYCIVELRPRQPAARSLPQSTHWIPSRP